MSTGTRASRVLRGISALDRFHGQQWVWAVSLPSLDVEQPTRCVVGQLADCVDLADYRGALERLGIEEGPAEIDAGFYARTFAEENTLNRLWSFAIRRLREQRPQGVAA